MAQWLRALPALPEVLGSTPSPHGSSQLSVIPDGISHVRVCRTDIHEGKTPIHIKNKSPEESK